MLNSGSGVVTDGSQTSQRRIAFEVCVRKTRRNIQRLADDPKSAAWAVDGNYFDFPEGFYEIGNWTSSFFTGMGLLAWQQTEDEFFLKQVLRLSGAYHEKVFVRHLETHHDLGFLASLYSVALHKLTGDKQQREDGLRAAEVLSQRFNPKGNFIRAWGRLDETISPIGGERLQTDNLAIIDCLMNLPLLYWASQQTGNPKYHDLAVRHADMALQTFVRPDDTVYHAHRFDLGSGKPSAPDNYCGHANESYWARGVTWAVYGFALSYGYTRDAKYLSTAVRLAKKFIAQLDQEVVPVWDFRLPPGVPPVRDASAAAVAVCAFQELAKHQVADPEILRARRALLDRLCAPDYLDARETCPGVLKSGYGNRVAYSSWGDYFLMEALARELFQFEPWW